MEGGGGWGRKDWLSGNEEPGDGAEEWICEYSVRTYQPQESQCQAGLPIHTLTELDAAVHCSIEASVGNSCGLLRLRLLSS